MKLSNLLAAKGKSGTTLVELLVVILIIAILSAMLLPAFTKNVVQAHYAAEAIPLVSHIRTQIAMYQYEHGKLPFDQGVYCYEQGSGSAYDLKAKDGATSGVSPIKKLGMSMSELCGKKLSPDQVSFAHYASGKAYVYAIGVFGKAGGLGEGTGYAVLEAYFPKVAMGGGEGGSADSSDKGYKLVATWSNYTGEGCGDEPGQIEFSFEGGGDSEAGEGKCVIFSGELLDKDNFEEAVSAAKEALGAGVCGSWDL